MQRTLRRLLPCLTILAIVGCETTQIASTSGDRVTPSVSVAIANKIAGEGIDSVSVRRLLQVRVNAEDNAALATIVTTVFADTSRVRTDSANLGGTTTRFAKSINFDLAGVRPGQRVRVVTVVQDGSGNESTAQAIATAFDPNVPKASLVAPDAFVIVGGTYTVSVLASDTTGLTKIGYRTAGSVVRADSSLFPVPLPRLDTVTYSITVPTNTPVGSTFSITPFAENRDGLRSAATPITVRVQAQGTDLVPPTVYQTVAPRLETSDSIDITARDSDGLIRIVGFIAKNAAGQIAFRSADTLAQPSQVVVRKKIFNAPVLLRGQTLFITGYATDVSGRTGYAIQTGSTIPVSADSLAKRDQIVYAYGLTFALPANSLGGDIAVDEPRATVYVSNINKNQLEAFAYGSTLTPLPSISVGAMPWGMAIDNSGSVLFVANSGGTNISRVSLIERREVGRIKTANAYLFEVQLSEELKVVGPIDYSDRPQYIAQSASGALYYSTRPTSEATPGTLRRLDNYLDVRSEPRQLWQYGFRKEKVAVILHADAVSPVAVPVFDSTGAVTDTVSALVICDHTPGQEIATGVCVQGTNISTIVSQLRAAPVNSDVEAISELDYTSLALPDTNFVAVGGDRRRVAFGEANSGGRAGRVMLVTDTQGTPPNLTSYSASIEIRDLTNNASDKVFGLAINSNSTNVGVHGAETFFADSSLRLQGKYATFNDGAGIAFHPGNVDENTTDASARVVFVASGDKSIQIVDSYTYRLRGRIPIRTNLYGPLRAVRPAPGDAPDVLVKLFGLTPEGLVVVDVRSGDILPP
ncbi:MAG: YncE family protein [Gemmatimonadaceae bacterium]